MGLKAKLRKLKLDRVDLVPAGANPGARIELFKGDRGDLSELQPTVIAQWLSEHPDQAREALKRLEEDRVSKSAEELQAELDQLKADKDKAEADLKEAREKLDATPEAEVETLKAQLAEKEEALAKAKGEPDVQKQLDETKSELAKLQKAERRRSFVAKAEADFKPLGQAEQIGRLLEAADEHFDEDERKLFHNLLAAASEQVEKGALFKRLSKAEDDDATLTWEQKLEKAAQEKVAKSSDGLTIEQARVQAMNENPELRRERELALNGRS